MKEFISRQFENPKGVIGKLVGMIMTYNNNERSNWAVSLMNVKPDDTILEIGFGPGITIKEISKKIVSGLITGVDWSEVMLQQAAKKNQASMKKGRVKLEQKDVVDLQYSGNNFDKIIAINTNFFWEDQVEVYKKLKEYLKSQGKIYIVFQPRWAESEEHIKNIAIQTEEYLIEAGFENVTKQFKRMKPVTCIGLIGEKV